MVKRVHGDDWGGGRPVGGWARDSGAAVGWYFRGGGVVYSLGCVVRLLSSSSGLCGTRADVLIPQG